MVYITHIRLSGGNGVQHITHVKWTHPVHGLSGTETRAKMAEYIRSGTDVRVSDGVHEVTVVAVDTNPSYIRTQADGRETNNLLTLPQF